jgi:hypothetical protein
MDICKLTEEQEYEFFEEFHFALPEDIELDMDEDSRLAEPYGCPWYWTTFEDSNATTIKELAKSFVKNRLDLEDLKRVCKEHREVQAGIEEEEAAYWKSQAEPIVEEES